MINLTNQILFELNLPTAYNSDRKQRGAWMMDWSGRALKG